MSGLLFHLSLGYALSFSYHPFEEQVAVAIFMKGYINYIYRYALNVKEPIMCVSIYIYTHTHIFHYKRVYTIYS